MMMRVTIRILLYQIFLVENRIAVKQAFEINTIASILIINVPLNKCFIIYLL